jgi:hypothetical protein
MCYSCLTGYALLSQKNGYSYCYPIPTETQCQKLSVTVGQGLPSGFFYCTQCLQLTGTTILGTISFSSYILTTANAAKPRNVCLFYQGVTNCVKYDTSVYIQGTQLICLKCSELYYLNTATNACVARTYVNAACSSYIYNADQCDGCKADSGTYLLSGVCKANPSGIVNCTTYSSATTCTQCKAPYYLSNNACVLSTDISQCAYFTGESTCAACNSGFFLVSTTSCVAMNASNCYTASDINTCSSCDPTTNYGLTVNTSGVTNCLPKLTDPNCLYSENVSPFYCT